MSSFLNRILEQKHREVEKLYRLNRLDTTRLALKRKCSFAEAIRDSSRLSVIAEIKRASPSKGTINQQVDVAHRARSYAKGNAAAVSVLTDEVFFNGSLSDLKTVRGIIDIPLLRKDFIIDQIQVDESLAAGADAVLLIAAALTEDKLIELCAYAKSIGLDVLIEIHKQSELESALAARPSVIGINNRDLSTFEVSLETTRQILKNWEHPYPVISESGLLSLDDVRSVAQCGVDGILVGEALMRLSTDELIQSTISAFSELPRTHERSGCGA